MRFTDKAVYQRIRSRDPLFVRCCDKLSMRNLAIERLGPGSVPELIRVGDDPWQFADLVGPFILKANHGSGWVAFVEAGMNLTERQIDDAQRWLETDYSTAAEGEWGYRDARHLIYAEELLPGPPPDYKFFTFSGKPELVQVDLDRFGDHQRSLMLPGWTAVQGTLGFPNPPETPAAPPNLPTMLEWAHVLAKDADFLRVDLYDLGTRVLVGELTPYPGGGAEAFRPRELDWWLGGKWGSLSA